jgi:hypothetical protein
MLTTRITIRAAAQELIQKASTDQYTKLFIAVDNILAPASEDTDKHYSMSERNARAARLERLSSGSRTINLITEHMEISYQDVQEHRDGLSKLINDAISNLESSWAEVARAYVELRFEYLRKSRI